MASHRNYTMYKCDKCDKSFITHTKLKKHQEKYTKRYTCPVENCSKVFEKWALMVVHKNNDHRLGKDFANFFSFFLF